MADNKLSEFLRDKKTKSANVTINWEAKRKVWVQAVKELYKEITDRYITSAIEDGSVKVSSKDTQITEEYIGDYTVPELHLQVGNERVVFSPKCMNIVGASGRIDLSGDMGEGTIIREDHGWAIVSARVPKRKVIPLNEESLLEALKTVMRQ